MVPVAKAFHIKHTGEIDIAFSHGMDLGQKLPRGENVSLSVANDNYSVKKMSDDKISVYFVDEGGTTVKTDKTMIIEKKYNFALSGNRGYFENLVAQEQRENAAMRVLLFRDEQPSENKTCSQTLADKNISEHDETNDGLYYSDQLIRQREFYHKASVYGLIGYDVGLSDSILNDLDLRGINLSGKNLQRASLVRTDLCAANLTNADFTEADFTEANLTSADLTHATITGIKLEGAKLDGIKITATQRDYLASLGYHPNNFILV
jgi:uncharacterized protein YjbI with pentapeptide repeats